MSELQYETCYIYNPAKEIPELPRPAKRRKTDHDAGLHASWPQRHATYHRLWSQHEEKLKTILTDLDHETVTALRNFVVAAPCAGSDPKIDSALLFSGPSLVTQASVLGQVRFAISKQIRSVFVDIGSNDASNLKAVLKRLNSAASSNVFLGDDEDDDEIEMSDVKGPRLLNYDLRILQRAVQEQKLDKVVVAFHDCEAIGGPLLSDLIDLLSCWKDRIPFVLIFGIATSIDTLQLKLNKRAIRCIRCRQFHVTDAESTTNKLFGAFHGDHAGIWLGPSLCNSILARQRDYLQYPAKMIDAVQYAYMTHFYANPLSILLDESTSAHLDQRQAEAIRNLPSFMQDVEDLLDSKGNAGHVKVLLVSDSALEMYVKQKVTESQETMKELVAATALYGSICRALVINDKRLDSDALVQALSATLLDSPKYRNVFLQLKRINSSSLLSLLSGASSMPAEIASRAVRMGENLAGLLKQQSDDTPLKSETDIQNSTLRTTVVAKKIELSKAKTHLTEADTAYTAILNDFIKLLRNYFSHSLVDPRSLTFHEIFLFDLRSPHRNVFGARPRFAIERALSSPHDYLDCQCCVPEEDEEGEADSLALSSTQPATAVLYQLYLESGALVNAADLKSAFVSIMADRVEDEALLSALFQRSVAELSFLGLLKRTKKKADHVVKLAWKGL